MPSYLQKRRRGYYAVMEIPRKLRPHFGKARFVKSLETRDEYEATRRVHAVVAEFIERLKADETLPTVDWVTRNGSYSRPITPPEVLFARLRKASTPEARAAILEEIDEAAGHIGSVNVEIGEQPSSDPEAQHYHAVATGSLVPFADKLDEWQSASRAAGTTDKTLAMQASDVRRFATEFPHVRNVERAAVKAWIAELMAKGGLAPKTVQRILSALRGYWRHLQSVGIAAETDEPFSKLDVARVGGKAKATDLRRPFEAAEIVKLMEAARAKDDKELVDVIDIGRWSGMRIEEIASLTIEHVKLNAKVPHVTVTEAKTGAGLRDVPVHATLVPTLQRLIGDRTSGYVLANLAGNKYVRSNGVGNRFGRLKTAQGFGPAHVFHSIRKTVATQLENAGVPVNIAADILGHEKRGDLTYGLYSGGASLTVKAEAIARLAY